VASAKAAVEVATNNYNNTAIVAPIDGTITSIDAKIGQIASSGAPLIGLISNQQFQVVIYISEADLGKIKVGDSAQVALSAYGDQTNFAAKVVDISADSSLVNNQPGYKVTLQFTNADDRIKSGMAARVAISDMTRQDVVAVPASALFANSAGNFVIKQDGSRLVGQPVQLGVKGLNNMVEITSGLGAGEQVVYFGK
ncbi:MAG: efflux RND transporter periplasmic adaptor subunit, partial [Patescibacteria group bacterium]|nr:efflux RND transporter periplasmic adaptor subunit [Patescibacteria group bacterium]